MGIVPMILGLPWVEVIKPKHKYAFAYSTGFFVGLALYEIVGLPVALGYGKFSTIVWIYSILLIFACGISLWFLLKHHLVTASTKVSPLCVIQKIKSMHWAEWVYLIAFMAVLSLQLVRGVTYDLTFMSYDDARYIVASSDAATSNTLLTIANATGEGGTLSLHYAFPAWNYYPAYLSTVSGVSITTIAHTFQYIQMILIAYTTYWFLAGEIIKKRDNQLIFMLIIAFFYWFGYHSHYSLTFRLLGPNYQGKAVLAVSLTPLILTIMIKKLEESYNKYVGVYLSLLSVAGLCLTLWSSGTMIVIILIPLLLSIFRRERVWKHILYVPWSLMIPIICTGYYLFYSYAV